jgi:hypothetical protein
MVGQLLFPFGVQELSTASQRLVSMNILAQKIEALQIGTMKKKIHFFSLRQMIMIKFQCFVETSLLNKTA